MDERIVYEATLEERVRLVEVRTELMRQVLTNVVEICRVLTKPRKEQTA
jgi:hypothetical protein